MMECMENDVPVPSIIDGEPVGLSPVVAGQFQVVQPEDEIDETINVGTTFSKYYYELMQKKPHKVGQLYLENSVLQWDGNPILTRESIQKFVEQLPALTFSLASMDCQQLHPGAVGNMKTYIIKTTGQFRASGVTKAFSQQIIITADGDKWRIAADDFRSQV